MTQWKCLFFDEFASKFIRESKNRIELRLNTHCNSNLFFCANQFLCVWEEQNNCLLQSSFENIYGSLIFFNTSTTKPFTFQSLLLSYNHLFTLRCELLEERNLILSIFLLLIYKILAHKEGSKKKTLFLIYATYFIFLRKPQQK